MATGGQGGVRLRWHAASLRPRLCLLIASRAPPAGVPHDRLPPAPRPPPVCLPNCTATLRQRTCLSVSEAPASELPPTLCLPRACAPRLYSDSAVALKVLEAGREDGGFRLRNHALHVYKVRGGECGGVATCLERKPAIDSERRWHPSQLPRPELPPPGREPRSDYVLNEALAGPRHLTPAPAHAPCAPGGGRASGHGRVCADHPPIR